MISVSGSSSSSGNEKKAPEPLSPDIVTASRDVEGIQPSTMDLEKDVQDRAKTRCPETFPRSKRPFKAKVKTWLAPGGKARPFRLLIKDIGNIRKRYVSDWTTFNQLVLASAVYVFFTNILPGITFASDLYVLTGMTWGSIEVVFSTGLCGLVFSL